MSSQYDQTLPGLGAMSANIPGAGQPVSAGLLGAKIQPRQAPTTAGGLETATVGDRRAGDYTLKPNVPVMVYGPTWDEGATTFRILPMPDYTNPSVWHPYCHSLLQFGYWSHPYNVVWAGLDADNKVSFVESDGIDADQVAATHPYSSLRAYLVRAIKRNRDVYLFQNFPELIDGWPCQMPPVSRNYYMAAAIYRFGNELLYGQPDRQTGQILGPRGLREREPLVLMRLSKPTAASLLSLLRMPRPDRPQQEGDWEGSFLYGDAVHPQHGSFITVFNRKVEAELAYDDPTQPTWQGGGDNQQGQETSMRYSVRIDRTGFYFRGRFYPLSPQLTDYQQELLARKWADVGGFLEDCFLVAPDEQQAVWVARAFSRIPEHYFRAAWEEAGAAYWLSDEVLSILRSRLSVQNPGISSGPLPSYVQPGPSSQPGHYSRGGAVFGSQTGAGAPMIPGPQAAVGPHQVGGFQSATVPSQMSMPVPGGWPSVPAQSAHVPQSSLVPPSSFGVQPGSLPQAGLSSIPAAAASHVQGPGFSPAALRDSAPPTQFKPVQDSYQDIADYFQQQTRLGPVPVSVPSQNPPVRQPTMFQPGNPFDESLLMPGSATERSQTVEEELDDDDDQPVHGAQSSLPTSAGFQGGAAEIPSVAMHFPPVPNWFSTGEPAERLPSQGIPVFQRDAGRPLQAGPPGGQVPNGSYGLGQSAGTLNESEASRGSTKPRRGRKAEGGTSPA